MRNNERLIFITAGEKSGDLHAAALVKEIKKSGNKYRFRFAGLGGDLMKEEGAELLYHINQLTTSGITGVLKKYKYFKNVLKECIEYVKSHKPDVIILIDFPGFNLRFAEEIRKCYDVKIIYYISPQVWAWHKSRVYKIKRYIDEMLVVFPFEVGFYKGYGVNAEYVGHPLTKRIKSFLNEKNHPPNPPAEAGFRKLNFQREKAKRITILPGSRNEEIENHLPTLIRAAEIMASELDAEIVIHAADSVDKSLFEKWSEKLKKYSLSSKNVYDLILDSDLILTKAGTSTIECALIGTPFMIFYRTTPLNYHLIKPLVNIKNMGMVNILAGEDIIKEFIQNDFTPENLAGEAKKILNDERYRETMKENMKKIREILGDEDASVNAARMVLSSLKKNEKTITAV